MKALVIGGGIAGPATAIALQKAGIEAEIFEAHPHGADGIGSFLTLASNGIDALRVLGIDAAALAVGFETPGMVMRNSAGRELGSAVTGIPLPDGTVSHTVRRPDLYRVMYDAAVGHGITFRHGARLVGVEPTGHGVRAVFADGTDAVGDLLIGADGVNSTVRELIDPDAPAPKYAGLLNTGGYSRGVPVDAAAGAYEMIFGRRGFFGYSLDPDGEVWWFANVPSRAAAADPGDVRERLIDLFAGDAGPAVALVRAGFDVLPLTPVHTVPRLPHWHRGRMIVIGDAAHAPSPSSGQGASLAVEDAVLLAMSLRDNTSPEAAFAAFVRERRPRVERIIAAAARVNSSKAAGPIAARIRDAMMPSILRMTARSKATRAVFDHHIDWEATVRA